MKEIKIFALGSSVTKGYANNDLSFVEKLSERRDQNISFKVIKEAVNGTTLANRSKDSYLARLLSFNKDTLKDMDFILVQLSTNDLYLKNNDFDSNDEKSSFGAISSLVNYVKKNFKAKIVFYTCFIKENKDYEKMILKLKEMSRTCDFDVVDFYFDETLRNSEFDKLMADPIHPNDKCYEYMSDVFARYFEKSPQNSTIL